jgi:hypothetical protein
MLLLLNRSTTGTGAGAPAAVCWGGIRGPGALLLLLLLLLLGDMLLEPLLLILAIDSGKGDGDW